MCNYVALPCLGGSLITHVTWQYSIDGCFKKKEERKLFPFSFFLISEHPSPPSNDYSLY